MVKNDPLKFYTFNDQYFMNRIHTLFYEGFFDKEIRMKEITESLLFEKSPRTIRVPEFQQRILNQDDDVLNDKFRKKAHDKVKEIQAILKSKGTDKDWIVEDIPKKNIIFVRSKKQVIKKQSGPNVMLERDPAKILTENGDVQLLVDVQNSIIANLQDVYNFVPNVYCSESAYQLLKQEKIID
jgi:hypothetical protein